MAHVRPESKTSKHRLASCKKGKHDFGEAQYIGAGIARQVCGTCAAVSIDLTTVDDSLDTPLVQTHRTIHSLTNKDS